MQGGPLWHYSSGDIVRVGPYPAIIMGPPIFEGPYPAIIMGPPIFEGPYNNIIRASKGPGQTLYYT
jgi:hypothetical protein